MASNQKRMIYVSDYVSSTEEESCEEYDYQSKKENGMYKVSGKTRRMPRCLSKNALMARENRLKKKIYVNKLEREVATLKNDNKKLSAVVRKQCTLVTEMKREVKYLKSVISNSSDIKNLIRNIHDTTGMSVSSSLDENLSLNNICVPKLQTEEKIDKSDSFPNYDCLLGDVNLNMDWYGDITDYGLNAPDDIFKSNSRLNLEDHNYTAQKDDEVGVCLHVSNHRVSLEFCTKCSEKAEESWSQLKEL